MISKVENFISEEDHKFLIEYIKYLEENDKWDKSDPHPSWHGRYVHANLLAFKGMFGTDKDIECLEILIGIRNKIRDHIINIRNLNVSLYSDTLQIVRWLPGNEQHPHADSENPDGSPHPYPWREHASIVYLNDEFDGGVTYFPELNVDSKPTPRTLVTFPGTKEYMHGVTKVDNGRRYTIASFWTTDPLRGILVENED